MRMAGSAEDYRATVTEFCRELGVGFQIVNDLGDWVGELSREFDRDRRAPLEEADDDSRDIDRG